MMMMIDSVVEVLGKQRKKKNMVVVGLFWVVVVPKKDIQINEQREVFVCLGGMMRESFPIWIALKIVR
jgi:hypothetical protein